MIGQNKVKICKLWSQKFKFLDQRVGCPSYEFVRVGINYKAILMKW